jgi:hypothetical protein
MEFQVFFAAWKNLFTYWATTMVETVRRVCRMVKTHVQQTHAIGLIRSGLI